MAKKLYEVRITHGKCNKNWLMFFNNVGRLNGKPPSHQGIDSVVIISHHVDAATLHSLCTAGFNNSENDVTIDEITKYSLENRHKIYMDLVEDFYLPFGKYPNIQSP